MTLLLTAREIEEERSRNVAAAGSEAGWGIPIASHTSNVTIGAVARRPRIINGSIENVEHLCLTLSFDHDIVDGAPAARFIKELTKLIRSGISLQ